MPFFGRLFSHTMPYMPLNLVITGNLYLRRFSHRFLRGRPISAAAAGAFGDLEAVAFGLADMPIPLDSLHGWGMHNDLWAFYDMLPAMGIKWDRIITRLSWVDRFPQA